MLKLAVPPTPGKSAIPAHVTTLSVSWLNNQFKAAAIHRGQAEAVWECPGPVDGAGRFEELIKQAVEKTGYRGQTVSLLLAHPRLVQQLVEVPLVKGPSLKKILKRQAHQQKMFTGEAAWAWQGWPSGKGPQRVVLHLFPKPMLTQLLQGCQRNSLYLTSVLPPSAVLYQQLRQLPLEKGEVALLAAETGGSTTIVIGGADGPLFLARTLPGNWNEAEKLALDLNRTILFVNQQLGVTVNRGIWLFGLAAEEQANAVQQHSQLPVQVSPVAYDPFYWTTEAAKLPLTVAPNFISPDLQKAPQRHVFAKVVAGTTIGVLLASVSFSAYANYQARQEEANIKLLSGQFDRLQTLQRELQQRNEILDRGRQLSQAVLEGRQPPVPMWFLGYLSEAVPADLVVTNLQIKHEDRAWKVRLAGAAQSSVPPVTPEGFAKATVLLADRLSTGPFHLKILRTEGVELAQAPRTRVAGSGSAIQDWLANVSNLTPKPKAAHVGNQFVLEGTIR